MEMVRLQAVASSAEMLQHKREQSGRILNLVLKPSVRRVEAR